MLWSGRSAYESVKLFLQLAERQEKQAKFRENGFNLFSLPIKTWKAYADPRDLSELNYIISHVTAVTNGFGVSTAAKNRWLKVLGGATLLRSTGYPALDYQLTEAGVWTPRDLVFEPSDNETASTIAKRLGLWERYRGGVPYHQIAAANGDNLANRELEHRTWHADLGNFGVGFAVDCGADQVLDDWLIETGRKALITLYNRIISVSEKARRLGVFIAPHRCFSGSRRKDTNYIVHQEIILPVVEILDGLEVDYTIAKGKGLQIPVNWDTNALYDAKGNKLRKP